VDPVKFIFWALLCSFMWFLGIVLPALSVRYHNIFCAKNRFTKRWEPLSTNAKIKSIIGGWLFTVLLPLLIFYFVGFLDMPEPTGILD